LEVCVPISTRCVVKFLSGSLNIQQDLRDPASGQTHDLTSGNHCVVKVGHSKAELLRVKGLEHQVGQETIPKDHVIEKRTILLPCLVFCVKVLV
jgi:hypothetical protein